MSLIRNKKLNLYYEIKESLEAGIELRGYETKSLAASLGSLEGAKVIVRGGEAFLIGSYIPAYQIKNTPKSYDPYRVRRLLLNKKEIIYLNTSSEGTGLSIMPVSFYQNKKIKLEIALCKKRNKQDKRNVLREKEDKGEMRKLDFGE